MGSHEPPQVKEIAVALDRSGHKFLWSLHVPPAVDAAQEQFISRILRKCYQKGSWKGSRRGGCWNSILESLWFSVPIVTWPMFAEQQLNAYMMKELGLAVVMRLDYRKGISDVVMADEIEEGVRQVMDAGREVRKKVKKTEEMARKAVMNGGSSFNSIGRFIEDMIGNI
ncbi:hypothetical protein Golax_007303 [Gossypium laxum]|uniref:Uncharacterized protein n=1 Tax=Gossypium laxum TaxID=34288 RepID=A0A7J9A7Y9_9ROSI|nr:hypothetical protein [Gossypium laxum]